MKIVGKGNGVGVELNHDEKSNDWPQILALFSDFKQYISQFFLIFAASIAGFSSGNLFSFPSPAIPKLLEGDYQFTMEEVSYLPVIPPISMMISTPIFCKLIDKIGRKRTLLAAGFFHIASWLFAAFANTIYLFYVSRIFSGLADATVFAAMPSYIAEIATPKIRGLYGNALVVALFSGQFLVNCVGYYLSISITSFVLIAFPSLFLLTFAFMPESPYYLIMIGDEKSAEKSLQRLRGRSNVQNELKQLNSDVQRQLSESGNLKDLWLIESNRKSLLITNVVRTFQQFSGITALVTYSQYIFMQAGGDISGGHAAMIFSGILAAVNIFSNLLTEKLGRRKAMMMSSFGCGTVLLTLSIYFYLQIYTERDVSVISWFPVFGIVVYVLFFSLGLGAVPTIMLGDMFSASIRKYATMVSNIVFAISMCVVAKLFQLLMSSYGLCVPFLLFCLCCFAGSVTSYFIIPETKGKTLEEIQQVLKGNKQEDRGKNAVN